MQLQWTVGWQQHHWWYNSKWDFVTIAMGGGAMGGGSGIAICGGITMDINCDGHWWRNGQQNVSMIAIDCGRTMGGIMIGMGSSGGGGSAIGGGNKWTVVQWTLHFIFCCNILVWVVVWKTLDCVQNRGEILRVHQLLIAQPLTFL